MSHKRHIYMTEETNAMLLELAASEARTASGWLNHIIMRLHEKKFGVLKEGKESKKEEERSIGNPLNSDEVEPLRNMEGVQKEYGERGYE